jgi:hypothetical protein
MKIFAAQTASRMLKSYGINKAIDAALDYRFNLYDYGTPGYLFWSQIIDLLVAYRKKHQPKRTIKHVEL